VTDLRPLEGGLSSITLAASLRRPGKRPQQIVLKVAPPGLEPVRSRDVVRQARLLRVLAAVEDLAVPAVLFTDDGPYNGSSLAVMGRNDIAMPERELAVVGGTGAFRMATGYVLWKTASWRGRNAVLELDAYVYASPAAAGA
jgi:hypothetical protein